MAEAYIFPPWPCCKILILEGTGLAKTNKTGQHLPSQEEK